jgi:hypothetical protein
MNSTFFGSLFSSVPNQLLFLSVTMVKIIAPSLSKRNPLASKKASRSSKGRGQGVLTKI